MRNLVFAFSLSAVVLVGCKSRSVPAPVNPSGQVLSQQPAVPPKDSHRPKFGWKQFREETFETNPLGQREFPLPAMTSKLRVSVIASSAVLGGVISKSQLDRLQSKKVTLRGRTFAEMRCSLQSVDKGQVACALDHREPMVYIVRDTRSEMTGVGALLGIHLHSRKMVERALLPNKIQIALDSWVCIESCVATYSGEKN